MGTVDDLTLLVEIIRAGSLSAASRKTGISKSSLSRRIGDLESELGVSLFHRGPRTFSVTEIGLSIYQRGQLISAELDAIKALAEDTSKRPTGALRISCPAILTEKLVAEFAVTFAEQYPEVRITLDTSKGTFDPAIDHYDLAIHPARDDSMVDSEMVRQKLASADYCLVAAPSAIHSLGPITSPAQLENGFGIGWNADGFVSRWKLNNRAGSAAELNVTLRFSANNLDVIKQAAERGLGMARLPFTMCETALREGRLIEPLPDWFPPAITIYAIYPSRRSLTLAGRLFIADLGRHLQKCLHSSKAR